MKRSTDRILTTHTGRLDPPKDLGEMTRARSRGENIDRDAYEARLHEGVAEIVKRQHETGIDVVSDGELGKFSSYVYYSQRLTGLKSRPVREGEPPGMWERTGERMEFAVLY